MVLAANNGQFIKSRALDGFIDAVTTALQAGDTVNLIGFGAFSVKQRAAAEAIRFKQNLNSTHVMSSLTKKLTRNNPQQN